MSIIYPKKNKIMSIMFKNNAHAPLLGDNMLTVVPFYQTQIESCNLQCNTFLDIHV